MSKLVVIGVDVGGTKIAAGLVSDLGEVITSKRYPTKSTEGRNAILEQIIGCITELERIAVSLGMTPFGVGVATPGLFDYQQGRVRFATTNLAEWTGAPLAGTIEQSVHLPCIVENDGNAAAFAESRVGSGSNVKDMLYIAVGTGVGGGVIIDRHLVQGYLGGAGGFGHVSIDRFGAKCYCGNYGCIELYSSGKAIAGQVREVWDPAALSVSRVDNSEKFNEQLYEVRYVLEEAKQGNAEARYIIGEAGRNLGYAAASAINLLNPELVVVGGGLATAGDLLLEPMRKVIAERTFPPIGRELNLQQSKLGGEVGLIGASLLAWEKLQFQSEPVKERIAHDI